MLQPLFDEGLINEHYSIDIKDDYFKDQNKEILDKCLKDIYDSREITKNEVE